MQSRYAYDARGNLRKKHPKYKYTKQYIKYTHRGPSEKKRKNIVLEVELLPVQLKSN